MKNIFLFITLVSLTSCASITETTIARPDGKIISTKVTKSPPSESLVKFFANIFFELFQAER